MARQAGGAPLKGAGRGAAAARSARGGAESDARPLGGFTGGERGSQRPLLPSGPLLLALSGLPESKGLGEIVLI